MTQAFGVLSRGMIFHLGDRLLTQAGRQAVTAFDPDSNKVVVFHDRNVLAVVCYAGRAYLDGVPVDLMIAETLADASLREQAGFTSVHEHGTNFGTLLWRLRDRIAKSYRKLTVADQEAPVIVDAIGWRRRRPGHSQAVPFAYGIRREKANDGFVTRVSKNKLAWDWRRGFLAVATPGVSDDFASSLRSAIRQGGSDPEIIRTALRTHLEIAATTRRETVGRFWIEIVAKISGTPHVVVRMLGEPAEHGGEDGAASSRSPWIVSCGQCSSPMIVRSDRPVVDLSFGSGLCAQFELANGRAVGRDNVPFGHDRNTTLFSFGSQTRPRDPQS